MILLRLVGSSLLLGLPAVGFAQSAAPAAYARFYGGLGVYSSPYHSLASTYEGTTRVPLQAVLGYQLRPRLAVQAALAYSSFGRSYEGTRLDPATGQVTTLYAGTYTVRYTTASLLARYTLTRKPAHRVQFDLLGGITLERSTDHETGFQTDSVQNTTIVTQYDEHYATTTLLLTAGASVRYRFGSRLEVVYDLTLNQALATGRAYLFTSPTTAAALGLRYRFGLR